jgi:hypothetical protein
MIKFVYNISREEAINMTREQSEMIAKEIREVAKAMVLGASDPEDLTKLDFILSELYGLNTIADIGIEPYDYKYFITQLNSLIQMISELHYDFSQEREKLSEIVKIFEEVSK